jgi:hypothetical protein
MKYLILPIVWVLLIIASVGFEIGKVLQAGCGELLTRLNALERRLA